MQDRGVKAPENDLLRRVQAKEMDQQVVQAYERYVMAQVWVGDQGEDAVRAEQKKAIESLIPGTLFYYHLYFLDLSKQMDFDQLVKEDKELYAKFKNQFQGKAEFHEVETAFHVVRKLQNLPKNIDGSTSDEHLNAYIKVTESIQHIVQGSPAQVDDRLRYNEPWFMKENAVQEGLESGSVSAQQQAEEGYEVFKTSEYFSMNALVEEANKKIEEKCKDDGKAEIFPRFFSAKDYYAVLNEVDWTLCAPKYAYGLAVKMAKADITSQLQLFEMKNEAFFGQICKYFKKAFDEQKSGTKFKIDERFLNALTLEQMDILSKELGGMGVNINDKKEYAQAYFSKQFSDELSPEYLETLSNEEKMQKLDDMYRHAKHKGLHKGLISSLLEQMLQLSLKLDQFREDLFKEYIARPTEDNKYLKNESVLNKNQKGSEKLQFWNKGCLQHIQVQEFNKRPTQRSSQPTLIARYLRLICTKNQGSLGDYREHFKDQYLNDIEKEVKVHLTDNGLIDLGDQLSAEEYKQIQDEVIIRFKETNKEQYTVDETVKIALELKNIPELVIKVFKFNSETYFRKTMKPIDTSIDLQGLKPSYMRTETDKFKGVKKNKIITEEFTFDELKGQVGIFIIEFQGNGKLGRVIIKKGSLTLVHRASKGGHIAYIIDEQLNICKSDDGKTGVLIDNQLYKTDMDKNGAIFIPFTSESRPKHQIVVLITNGFAQLGSFTREVEKYDLKAFSHVNAESVLIDQKATLFVRPKLTLNNRVISLSNLKSCKLEFIQMNHKENVTNHHTLDDLKLTDGQDLIYEFVVPSDTQSFKAKLTGTVRNVSQNKDESFTVDLETFEMQSHRGSDQMYELYLRQIGRDYYIHCLGKNGEPLRNEHVDIVARHHFYPSVGRQKMALNKNGIVKLGPLDGVQQISADVSASGLCSFGDAWKISSEKDQWTFQVDEQDDEDLPEPTSVIQMNIVQGETVGIPINFEGDTDNLKPFQLSLKKYSDSHTLANLTDKVKIEKSPKGTYKEVKLNNLEAGKYVLKLNMTFTQQHFIFIHVYPGKYWQEEFILSNNKLFEQIGPTKTIRIETVECSKDEAEPEQFNLKVLLQNHSANSRVHLLATQFTDNDPNFLKTELEKLCTNNMDGSVFQQSKWKNHFSDGKTVADEILYVLNRKQQEHMMGNLLENPSLLMRMHYVRDTETIEEKLDEGEKFEQVNLQAWVPPNAQRKMARGPARRGRNAPANECCIMEDDTSSKIKSFQNFLKTTPVEIHNLKPDSEGQVKATLSGLSQYTKLFIFACDDQSGAQRQLSVQDLLKTEQIDIERKDLRQVQSIPEKLEDGKLKGGMLPSTECTTLSKGDEVNIQDISVSYFQLVADLRQVQKIFELYEKKGKQDDPRGHDEPYLLKNLVENVFLQWPSFSAKQKLDSFVSNACHELNLFLARKDPQFFKDHVSFYIQNKLEHTFIDTYLLARFAADGASIVEMSRILNSSSALAKLGGFELPLAFEYGMTQENDPSLKEKVKKLIIETIELYNKNLKYDKGLDKLQLTLEAILNMQDKYNPWARKGASVGPVFVEKKKDRFHEMSHMRMARHMMMDAEMAMMAAPLGMQAESKAMFQSEAEAEAIFEDIRKKQAKFEDLDQTKEYKETHYLKERWEYKQSSSSKNSKDSKGKPEEHFAIDFLQNLLDGDSKRPFVSANFPHLPPYLFYIGFCLLDLPISIDSLEKYPHDIRSDGKKGVTIKAGCEAIMYKQEHKEGHCKLKKDVMIMHKYEAIDSRGNYRDDDSDDGNDDAEEGQQFKINQIYCCEVVASNISKVERQFDLIFKVPNGSIPMKGTQYEQTESIRLEAYRSDTRKYFFYFPEAGEYDHHPSIAYKVGRNSGDDKSPQVVIINYSETRKLVVKTQHVVSESAPQKSFKDYMLLAKTKEEKKQRILQILEENHPMVSEEHRSVLREDDYLSKLQRDVSEVLPHLLKEDKDMYFKWSQLRYKVNKSHSGFNPKHFKALLLDPNYASERQAILDQADGQSTQRIKSYIMRPVDSPILQLSATDITSKFLQHLEYFPLVNPRVFNFGKNKLEDDGAASQQRHETKDIRNVQLKETYRQFLLMLLNQDFLSAEKDNHKIQRDLWLRLVYYLLIQDRVREAHKVFGAVLAHQQALEASAGPEAGSAKRFMIVIDYMNAYFDFQLPKDDGFETARAVIAKYKDDQVDNFGLKSSFVKLELQLKGYDEAVKAAESGDLNAKDAEAIQKEVVKTRLPNLHDVTVDDQTGALTIESANIDKFEVNFYLIDAEILFSRSPFVQNDIETFSYVEPFQKLPVDAKKDAATVVELPEAVRNTNVIIEVQANGIQQFLQHYSCDLKVHIDEAIGELRVFQRSTQKVLPKVYIKVFVKMHDDSEAFFKDGFTDITGKFEYAKASSSANMQTSSFKRFALFACDKTLGSVIKDADATKLRSEGRYVSGYEEEE